MTKGCLVQESQLHQAGEVKQLYKDFANNLEKVISEDKRQISFQEEKWVQQHKEDGTELS